MAAIDTKITNMKWHFEYTKVHTPNAAVLDLSDKFLVARDCRGASVSRAQELSHGRSEPTPAAPARTCHC